MVSGLVSRLCGFTPRVAAEFLFTVSIAECLLRARGSHTLRRERRMVVVGLHFFGEHAMRWMRTSRRFITSMMAIFAVVLAVAHAPSASAQRATDIIGGPITTNRFERLVQAYITPSDAEMGALDRLHEGYLEKFRAEVEPEIDVIMSSINRGAPNQDQFEKLMRDIDRINVRISEADNAFLTAATELLAEDRRAGMLRVREARERQRLLSGIVQMGPMMMGSGAGFTDLPNLILRDAVLAGLRPENREAFDAALRSIEQRTLSQARAHNAETRKAILSFFAVYSAAAASMEDVGGEGVDADAAADGQMRNMEEQQRQIETAMREVGRELRKGIKSNFAANCAACAQLASLLPESAVLSLRTELARRTTGMMGMSLGIADRDGPKIVANRIRRDSEISAEVKAGLTPILETWSKAHADAMESLAKVLVDSEDPLRMVFGGMDDGSVETPVSLATAQLRAVSNDAFRQMTVLLGERADQFIRRVEQPDDSDVSREYFMPVPKKPTGDGGSDEGTTGDVSVGAFAVSGLLGGFSGPLPFEAADVARIGAVVGLDTSSLSVIEAVVDAWKSAQWDAQMDPIEERLTNAWRTRVSSGDDGVMIYDPKSVRASFEARAEAGRLLFDLDERLYADLAGALGIPSDDVLLLLLRLERANLLARQSPAMEGVPISVWRVFTAASVDPKVARGIIEEAKSELSVSAAELPKLLTERLATAEKIEAAERVFATRDQSAIERASRDYTEFLHQDRKANGEWGERVMAIFDAACVAYETDVETIASMKRARLRSTYPDIYRSADSAERQLADATRLPGLSDDQRVRIDALRAEYDAVYAKLCGEMAELSGTTNPGFQVDMDWESYAKKMAQVERIRFVRKERTDKALAELRRVLGPDRAVEVRGLVKDADEEAEPNQRQFLEWASDED